VHSFGYRNGQLHCEDVDLARVAEQLGTPTYVYSAGTILDHYARLDAALAPLDHLICYAAKANSNRAILKLLTQTGAGFDIVSGGELFRVLAAGGDPAKCTFAGVGKSGDPETGAQHLGAHSDRELFPRYRHKSACRVPPPRGQDRHPRSRGGLRDNETSALTKASHE